MTNGRQINAGRQRPSPIRPVYQYGCGMPVILGQLGRHGSQSGRLAVGGGGGGGGDGMVVI